MDEITRYDLVLKKKILDNRFAFAFISFDGFTSRLLSKQFTIDWNYNFILEMESFECRNKTNPLFREEGKLSDESRIYFEKLMESNYKSLNRSYYNDKLFFTGRGDQEYLLNFESETINISIESGLPIDYFKTETEKLLYTFNKHLYKITEEKYKDWVIVNIQST